MHFPVSSRALLQSMMASALVLAGATACSRPDRSESGRDNSAAVIQDTAQDTTTATGNTTESGAATVDTAPALVESNAPRAATAPAAARGETDAAGYRAMERDTANLPESDSARVTADTSETSLNTADTTAVETAEAAQPADTVSAAAVEDTSAAETAVSANAEDSTTIVATADAVESERIRPPEDSTELLGEVYSGETADEEPINANEQEISADDSETVATSESPTDNVGAAAIGGTVTGADAVALLTRQGARCSMVDESNEEARWDMSSTPVALNPCGMGSMVPSRIWTEK